jgi:superfamily II DNA or RNA helicase
VLKESKNNLVFINNAENDIKSLLDEIQKDVKLSHVKIVSAFFNYKGFVKSFLENCIENKIKIELITGSNPIHLNPTEAQTLFDKHKKNKSIFFLLRHKATKNNPNLHSKFYLFYEKGKTHSPYFLFGSSNMSVSGFSLNYESNLFGTNPEILKILENEFKNIPTTSFDPSIYKEKPKGEWTDVELGADKWNAYPYQQKIINAIEKEFKKKDKGNVILPCGTGKTLISLWLKEQMKFEKVLVFLPTLALLNQTMTEWHNQKTDDYQTMCVCSDKSIQLSEDETQFKVKDLLAKNIITDDRITTDHTIIKNFIDKNKKFVIFSTYHSSKKIFDACEKDKKFDCVFYDESHNIATIKLKASKEGLTKSHDIASGKKLFMTATPKLVDSTLIDGITKEDYNIYSMDNEEIFGPTFYNMSFKEAIDNPKIPVLPYKILLTKSTIKDKNENVRKQHALLNLLAENEGKTPRHNVNKIISYHKDIASAKSFIGGNFKKIWTDNIKAVPYFEHINGAYLAKERKKILDGLDASEKGIISNCRCLSEGIDTPSIDAVFFSDPKTNVIDIVQATGRAMRVDKHNSDKKYAYVVIPIIDSTSDQGESFQNLIKILHGLALTHDDVKKFINHLSQAYKNNKQIKKPDWIDFVPKLSKTDSQKIWKNIEISIAKATISVSKRPMPGNVKTTKGFYKTFSPSDLSLISKKDALVKYANKKGGGQKHIEKQLADKWYNVKDHFNKDWLWCNSSPGTFGIPIELFNKYFPNQKEFHESGNSLGAGEVATGVERFYDATINFIGFPEHSEITKITKEGQIPIKSDTVNLFPKLKEQVRAFGHYNQTATVDRGSNTEFDPRFTLRNKSFYKIFSPGDIIQFKSLSEKSLLITFIRKDSPKAKEYPYSDHTFGEIE